MCGAKRKGSMAKYLQTSVGTQAASPSWEKKCSVQGIDKEHVKTMWDTLIC